MEAAVKELVQKAKNLEAERLKISQGFRKQIREILDAIEKLTGKKSYEVIIEYENTYNDQSPDYITGTEDGI